LLRCMSLLLALRVIWRLRSNQVAFGESGHQLAGKAGPFGRE
jgi:hypothetical protein